MNKKLIFGLLGLLCIGMVAATIGYYAMFSTTINIDSAVTLEDCEDELEGFAGETIIGKECEIKNNAPSERQILITSSEVDGITTSYIGSLVLSKKDDKWKTIEGQTQTITYTIVGNEFEATSDLPEGYVLVYAMDKENRFEDYAVVMKVEDVNENLPYDGDWNSNPTPNYCDDNNGHDDYNQCSGSKIWMVKESDLVELEDNIYSLSWTNMADYYYETDLIQYNSEGNIILSPESELTITPVYEIGKYVNGTVIVTTTIA